MKLLIEGQAPDGFKMTMKEPISVDTWQPMFDFAHLESELELAVDKMDDLQRHRLYDLFDEIIRGKKVES